MSMAYRHYRPIRLYTHSQSWDSTSFKVYIVSEQSLRLTPSDLVKLGLTSKGRLHKNERLQDIKNEFLAEYSDEELQISVSSKKRYSDVCFSYDTEFMVTPPSNPVTYIPENSPMTYVTINLDKRTLLSDLFDITLEGYRDLLAKLEYAYYDAAKYVKLNKSKTLPPHSVVLKNAMSNNLHGTICLIKEE